MWRIWFQQFDKEGKHVGSGVITKSYTYRGNAVRFAKKHFANPPKGWRYEWTVSKENPWRTMQAKA